MAFVPAPDFTNYTIQQLFDELHGSAVGSPAHQQAMFMLQFRLAEQQAQAAAPAAAQRMIAPTQALAAFTGALAVATWALFVVAGATAALTVVQILIALKVIGR